MISVALVGLGRIGMMHAGNLHAHPRFRLAVVFDPVAAAAEEAAAKYGARSARSAEDAVKDDAVAAVVVASTTATHCDYIEMAAACGKAVLCEKPVGLDMGRVERTRAKIAGSGTPVMVGFNRRFDPGHERLRTGVASGQIGSLRQVVITSRDPVIPGMDYLRGSGGIFRDMMIHDIDMARAILGEEPQSGSVQASLLIDGKLAELGDYDSAMVLLRTGSGKLCFLSNSRECCYGYDQRIEAFGSGGMLISDNHSQTETELWTAGSTRARAPLRYFFLERYAESYRRELDVFADTAEGRCAASPDFEDGRRALVIADALATAAAGDGTVRISHN